MMSLAILISLLVILVVSKVVYNRMVNTIDVKEEETTQSVINPISDSGVLYIYPKRTLEQSKPSSRYKSNLQQIDQSNNNVKQEKYSRVQQILQANPPRERKKSPQITVKEWIQNDLLYQQVRTQLRTTG